VEDVSFEENDAIWAVKTIREGWERLILERILPDEWPEDAEPLFFNPPGPSSCERLRERDFLQWTGNLDEDRIGTVTRFCLKCDIAHVHDLVTPLPATFSDLVAWASRGRDTLFSSAVAAASLRKSKGLLWHRISKNAALYQKYQAASQTFLDRRLRELSAHDLFVIAAATHGRTTLLYPYRDLPL
jgi:hypothetical protein